MPRFAILRWIPEDMKYVVEHYGYKESEVRSRLEVLIERYSEENLSLLIEMGTLSDKIAHNRLKSILKGARKRDK